MPEPTTELVFNSLIEGLWLNGLRGRVPPDLVRALRGAGIDLEKKLDPAYPLPVFVNGLELTARSLYPALPLDDAMFHLGTHAFEGFANTFVGKAMFPLLKVIGPHRTLQRMTKNFQTGNNYTRAELKNLGANEAEIWLSRVVHAGYYRGLLEPAMAAAGARGARVEVTGRENGGATFRIRWA